MNAAAIVGAGAALGVLNAAHCAGMCGAFALQAAGGERPGCGLSLYLLGKTFTYVFLGALAGAAGAAALAASSGWQVGLAVAGGAALLLAGVRTLRAGRPSGPIGAAVNRALAPLLVLARCEGGPVGRLLYGAATGLVPCGLVYLAALQGAAFGSAGASVLFMAGFGVGTGPALGATGLLGRGLLGGRVLGRLGLQRVRVAGGVLLLLAGLASLARAGMAISSGDPSRCLMCAS